MVKVGLVPMLLVWERDRTPYTVSDVYIDVHFYPPPSPQGDPLWSARLLHSHPAVIAEIHRSYLEHGADVITTASYQVSWRRHTLVVELFVC